MSKAAALYYYLQISDGLGQNPQLALVPYFERHQTRYWGSHKIGELTVQGEITPNLPKLEKIGEPAFV